LSIVRINEFQFADNLALYAVDLTMFELAGRKFVKVGSQFGLTMSIPKTKGLAIGVINESDISPVEVGSGMIEMVRNFTYLGSNLSSDCEATCEVKCWIAKASKAIYFLVVRYLLILYY